MYMDDIELFEKNEEIQTIKLKKKQIGHDAHGFTLERWHRLYVLWRRK